MSFNALEEFADASSSTRFVPHLPAKMSCREALRTINGYPDVEFFIVCDSSSKPLGYLERKPFLLALTRRLGLGFYSSKPVRRLMIPFKKR
jgi:hypothetical protein